MSTRTALVTGGGRGIGAAIARELARAGHRVLVVGRTRAELEAVAAEVGGEVVEADLATAEGCRALVDRVEALAVDVLVNNAGVAESEPLARTTDELWERAMALNATAPFRLARGLVPAMVRRGFGRVIQVASNAGLTGYAYTSAYVASKHAVVGLTRALAKELATTGVTVNAVCPGFVRTAMTEASIARIVAKTGRSREDAEAALAANNPQRRLVEPEEVAAVVALLASDRGGAINGQAIPVDGGQVTS